VLRQIGGQRVPLGKCGAGSAGPAGSTESQSTLIKGSGSLKTARRKHHLIDHKLTSEDDMKRKCASGVLATIGLLATPGLSADQGKDVLWEITGKSEMAGAPMPMPPRTYRACLPKEGREGPDIGPDGDNCKTVETRKIGNKTAFKTVCTGKEPMTATGETVHRGDSFTTTMHMKIENGGYEMTQTMTGKRVGSCDAQSAAQHR
jgi:hypothetical protein